MSRPLSEILELLETLAPLALAEDWDNVGLLVEPARDCQVSRVLLTVDLTEPVLSEAIEGGAELVIAYHPPIFRGLKRLTRRVASERIPMDALRAGIAVYSPHTALDAATGGINDWLAGLLGPGRRRPIVPHPRVEQVGAGRIVQLDEPMPLVEALGYIKSGLSLPSLRVAAAHRHQEGEPIETFAVCAGAGGSVFEKLPFADLWLTGEMRHHDVLARVAEGQTVVLTDHTNTERGFLPKLAACLRENFTDVAVRVSSRDADPLVIQ
jgi:dinuclear metal center YbgI/SA1388 family protein